MPPWLIQLDTCDSTNTWALAHAGALAHGAVIWTERQTAGRGRQGRSWLAPAGVLTASFCFEPPALNDTAPLSLAAGLAVIHACEDLCPGLTLGLKWPNDVLHQGRKLAGILCERSDAPHPLLAIGVGLNVAPVWPESQPPVPASSLAAWGPAPSQLDLIVALRRYLLEALGLVRNQGLAPLLPQLAVRDTLKGQSIALVDGGRTIRGTAAGIDVAGNLLVDTGASRERCRSGHLVGP